MNEAVNYQLAPGLRISVEPGCEHQLQIPMPRFIELATDLKRVQRSPLIVEYLETVLSRFLREASLSSKSQTMLSSRVRKLKQVLTKSNPERRIGEIDKGDVETLKRNLPAELRKNQRSKSQGSNIETYYQIFNRIMDQAVEDQHLVEPNKISVTRKKRAEQTKPFLDADLRDLFSSWPMAPYEAGSGGSLREDAQPYRFWLMPLGIFTGARLNELCQLQVRDVIKDSDGVHLISINDNAELKSLKNEQSRREIPISSHLINIGFLQFVAERRQAGGDHAMLFDELEYRNYHQYSRGPSRFFCGPRTGAGFIGRYCPQASSGGFNFKSFRRTFALQLEKSHVPAHTIAQLMGHETSGLSVTEKHYLDKSPSKMLLDHLESGLSYSINLEGVHWNCFKNLMASQRYRSRRGRKMRARH